MEQGQNISSPIEKVVSLSSIVAHSYICDEFLVLKEGNKLCTLKRCYDPILLDAKFYGEDVLILCQGAGKKQRKEDDTDTGCRILWWDLKYDRLKKMFSFDENTFDTLTVHENYVWLSENVNFKLWKPEGDGGFIFDIKRNDIVKGKVEQTCVHNRNLYALLKVDDGEYRLDAFDRYGQRFPQPMFNEDKKLEGNKIFPYIFVLCFINDELYALNYTQKLKLNICHQKSYVFRLE